MAAIRDYKYVPVDVSASGGNTVISFAGIGAPAGSEIRVVSYHLIAAGPVTVQWFSAGQPRTGVMSLAANSGLVVPAGYEYSAFEGVANGDIVLNLGGAVQVGGALAYYVQKD